MKIIGRTTIVAAAVSLVGLSGIVAGTPAPAMTSSQTRSSSRVARAALMNGAEKPGKDAPIHGSIKVEGEPGDAELAKMAKISKADAERIALKALEAKAEDKKFTDSELEVEDGYLVYSIEMTVKGRKGIDEILVDAGNGKILSREHEDETLEKEEGTAEDPGEDDED